MASSSPGTEDKVTESPEKLGAKGKELIQQPKKATEEAQNASRKPKPPREQGKVA